MKKMIALLLFMMIAIGGCQSASYKEMDKITGETVQYSGAKRLNIEVQVPKMAVQTTQVVEVQLKDNTILSYPIVNDCVIIPMSDVEKYRIQMPDNFKKFISAGFLVVPKDALRKEKK